MDITIKDLEKSDFEGINQVDRLTQKQYLKENWDQMSEEEKQTHLVSRSEDFGKYLNIGFSFVAILNKKIVGFILVSDILPDSKKLFIQYIAIDPQEQGKKIGRLLLSKLKIEAKKNNIKEITALINLDNPYSIKLHQAMGYTIEDRKEAVLILDN